MKFPEIELISKFLCTHHEVHQLLLILQNKNRAEPGKPLPYGTSHQPGHGLEAIFNQEFMYVFL